MFACDGGGNCRDDPPGLEVFQPSLLDDLEGLDPAFDSWLAEQRQRVTQLALSVAEEVLAFRAKTKARIAAAERLLAIDRMHEPAWQALIRAQLEQGRPGCSPVGFRAILQRPVACRPCPVARNSSVDPRHTIHTALATSCYED